MSARFHSRDLLFGFNGNDTIKGGDANDFIYGGSGADELYGGENNDLLSGGDNSDMLDGGRGTDQLFDDSGNSNIMYGGIDEDRLRDYTTTGNSYLYGGAGHDIYEFRLNTTTGTAVHHDVIRDLDGDGQVTFANTLTNTTLILSGPANYDPARDCWTMGSGGTILMKLVGADLVVKYDDLNYITIKNFGDGDPYATYLGIRLPQPTPNSGDDSVIGDGHPLGVANPGYLDAVNPLDDTGIYDVAHDPIDTTPGGVNDAMIKGNGDITGANQITAPRDPLVLDLNHDGVHLTSVADSSAHFDLDGNGFAEKTGWLSADDGFLVRDLNSNGSIDNITEMFGNSTQAGLVHLATLDSNADGKITAADTAWSTLKVWQDTDGDGVTDAGELHSLSEYGIDTLTLASQFDGRSLEGNIIARVGSFSEGAVKGDLAEIFFQTDNFDSQYIGTGGTGAVIDPTTLDLPLSRGYGNLPSLQQAMTNDATLKTMVEALATTSYINHNAAVDAILYRWAGITSSTVLPNVTNFDPMKLEFLEVFSGQNFTNLQGTTVNSLAVPFLTQAWNEIRTELADRLVVQGELASLFPQASYSFASDTLSLGSTLEEILANLDANATLKNDITLLHDLQDLMTRHADGLEASSLEIATAMGNRIVAIVGSPDDLTYGLGAKVGALTVENTIDIQQIPNAGYYTGTMRNDMIFGRTIGEEVYGGSGNDYILTGAGNDNIGNYNFGVAAAADRGHDIVLAGDGNDQINYMYDTIGGGHYLSGGNGNDTLNIKGINDTVLGGEGDDTLSAEGSGHVMDLGNGNDYIVNLGFTNSSLVTGAGNDIISQGGITGSTVLLGDGNDYVDNQRNTAGAVGMNLYNHSLLDGGAGNDDMRLSYVTDSTVQGGAGDDVIFTMAYNNSINNSLFSGGDGNDSIAVSGVYQSATVLGGEGNDVLYVGQDANHVLLQGNNGNDLISVANGVSGMAYMTVEGGLGDDTLQAGSDMYNVYRFSTGDGNDVLRHGNYNFAGGAYNNTNIVRVDGYDLHGQAAYAGPNHWTYIFGTTVFDLNLVGSNVVITRAGVTGDSITLENFPMATGMSGITLQGGDHYYVGTTGNDSLTGSTSNDLIQGLAGNDTLVGGAGADTLEGSDGVDVVSYANSSAGVTVNLALTTAQAGGDAAGDVLFNIENVTGSAYSDTLTGDANANMIDGGAGTDIASYANSTAAVNVNIATNTHSGGFAAGDSLLNIENVVGSDYNDTITGNSSSNQLLGGLGNDYLIGGAGSDILNGGTGTDTVYYSTSSAAVNVNLTTGVATGGDAAGDTLISIENLLGSNYNDTLTGDALANSLTGLSGNDVLTGNDGNDVLTGGTGADTLDGGTGVDTASYASSTVAVNVNLVTNSHTGGEAAGDSLISIENLTGSAYNDTLTGDSLDNLLTGGAGIDSLIGGDGNDLLLGSAGADAIDGGNGVDTASYSTSTVAVSVDLLANVATGGDAAGDSLLSIENLLGSSYNDTLTGNALANQLSGGNGNDVLNGSGGDDVLVGGLGSDTLDGGIGIDTAVYNASAGPVTVNLTTNTSSGSEASGDKLYNIENVTGSIYNDLITGDAADNFIFGGLGNDSLAGAAGADTLDGSDGLDLVTYALSTTGVTVNLTSNVNSGGDAMGDSLLNMEHVTGSGYADHLTGNTLANMLTGGNGNDSLYGGTGNDSLYGNSDNDFMEGGAGADSIDGSYGIDTVSYASSSAAVTVNMPSGVYLGGDAAGDTLVSIENIIGSGYNDILFGTTSANELNGGSGNDSLYGGDGSDTLIGGSGNDVMDGGTGSDTVSYASSAAAITLNLGSNASNAGDALGDTTASIENAIGTDYNDTITGNSSVNVLVGGAGNDTLYGLSGNDTITGGLGNDWMDGGTGDDIFTFAGGSGTDIVYNFEGEGITGGDVIQFLSSSGLTSFAGVQAATTYDFGLSQAVIHIDGSNSITLTGVTQSFSSGDFAFA